MQIYLAKNEQKFGPYTPDEVRARIAAGQVSESDPGWHAGLAAWLPVSQVLASLPVGLDAAPPLSNKSGLATASFIVAMLGIGAWFILIVAAAAGVSAGAGDTSPLMVGVGLFMFAGIAGNLVGVGLGVAALTKSISNKWMAVTGVIVNGAEVAGILLLMLIGLAQK